MTDKQPLRSSQEQMFERRSIGRTMISKSAKLFFNAQCGVMACGVRDITNVGAGIRVDGLNILPVNFDFSFDNFHTTRECRLVWRDGDFVGVVFQN